MRKIMSWSFALFLCALCALSGVAHAGIIFSDNFNDGNIANPTYSSMGAKWSTTAWTYWDYLGGLAYNESRGSDNGLMSINFGATAPNTPVEVRFKLRQHDLAVGCEFSWGLKNSSTGLYYQEDANSNPSQYGFDPACGFHSYTPGGDRSGGLALSHLSNGNDSPNIWDYIKLKFVPGAGVEIWQARATDNSKAYNDPSLTYTLNATWSDFNIISSVDTFYMMRAEAGGRWMVDDVEVEGTLQERVAMPEFSPDRGSGEESAYPIAVVISCPTAGADIYYTMDGSEPSDTHGTLIASGASVLVSSNTTLKAKAYEASYNPSATKTSLFQPLVFVDNFNDGAISAPTYTSMASEWSAAQWAWKSNFGGTAYNESRGSNNGLMSVNFGATVPNTPVEARFKLFQEDLAAGVEFSFGMKNSTTGLFYQEDANSNPTYYGYNPPCGWRSFSPGGDVIGGLGYSHLSNINDAPNFWDYIKFKFVPGTGVEIWQARSSDNTKDYNDPSLTYTLNVSWVNFKNISSMDTFYMLRSEAGGRWFVDDVNIMATLVNQDPFVEKPVMTPSSGVYTAQQNVTISCATSGATIRYTTDGSEPCVSSAIYTQPLQITGIKTIRAKAWAPNHKPSPTAVASYKIPLVFKDNWDDKTVFGPFMAQSGVDWSISSGLFSANTSLMPSGFDFLNPISQSLMFNSNQSSKVSVNFGTTQTDTPVEVRFKLAQTKATAGPVNSRFMFGIKNTVDGLYYEEQASQNPTYYGSGFHNWAPYLNEPGGPDDWVVEPGDVAGSSLAITHGEWNYIKMFFDPNGYVEIWQAISTDKNKSYEDGTLSYRRVAHWSNNVQAISSVNQFYMYNEYVPEETDAPNWAVDDVEIVADLQSNAAAVSKPVFSQDGGVIGSPINVAISCATSGATIRYTTDGSTPTASTGTIIASGSSVNVDHTMILTAKAFKSGLAASTAKSELYLYQNLATIGEVKGLSDRSVSTSGVVSAVFDGFLYIETTDRAYGIRVNKAAHGRSVGQVVTVNGTVTTLASGERYIDASSVDPTGGPEIIKPLGVTNKALGGGLFGLQAGVADASGLNNIGLFIKTTGRVGSKGASWFMIDDGSGVSVKVYGNVPSGTPYVTVTGVSSCERDGSSKIQRVILATDVQLQ